MTRFRISIGGAGACLVLALSACSAQPRQSPPSEEELHAGDGEGNRTPVRHLYHCNDGRERLVDFKNEGLTIEVRRDAQAPPVILTAPTQGRPYVGKSIRATFDGSELKLEAPTETLVICTKETKA